MFTFIFLSFLLFLFYIIHQIMSYYALVLHGLVQNAYKYDFILCFFFSH